MSLTEVSTSPRMGKQPIPRVADRGEQVVRDEGLKIRELNL
jgi:hypothetical protein